ncbi:MvaI/BcnI family restriction endonuclease [Vibrio crassostreae]|uniref:MvaI/BcnI family restriction endonuclease n=1 Tax=Vibrio crassostreae TaxID=246167 RepID=UPI001B308019|nr:MvaI/BcnI family restriction endonuclease [Vibrio crassostreae]
MNKNELERVFHQRHETIKEKGWVTSLRKGNTGVGYTYETLMGVKENNSQEADFGHIEFKTTRATSKGMISLFTYSPRNREGVMKDVHERFGTVDKRGYKTFYSTIKGGRFNTYKKTVRFSSVVNWRAKKVELVAKTVCGEELELDASYSFLEIEKLVGKLDTTAFVKAKVRKSGDCEQFLYDSAELLRFKGVKNFLKLLDEGVVAIDIRIGVYKKGNREGQCHDHGTAFRVKPNDLALIFH